MSDPKTPSGTEPYRTPAEVSETLVPIYQTRKFWLMTVAGLFVAGAAMAMLTKRTPVREDSVINYIEDYGGTRTGPIEEPIEIDGAQEG